MEIASWADVKLCSLFIAESERGHHSGISNVILYLCPSTSNMWRKSLAAALLISFLLQSFNQTLVLTGFYFNQDYIAKTQCENRYRPQLNCNGKCILAKKLKEADNNNRQNQDKNIEQTLQLFYSSSFIDDLINNFLAVNRKYALYSNSLIEGFRLPIFHPPGHYPC